MALLYILIGVLALVILALAIPVEVEISAAVHGRVVTQIRFKLFFGLVAFNVRSGAGRKKPREEGSDRISFPEKLFHVSQVDGIWSRCWRLVRSLASCVKLRRLAADLSVSLGDDYYTGMLAGLAIPLVLYLDQEFNGGILLRPAFEEDLFFEGDLSAGFSLYPLKMVLPCLVFACSPQFRGVKGVLGGER